MTTFTREQIEFLNVSAYVPHTAIYSPNMGSLCFYLYDPNLVSVSSDNPLIPNDGWCLVNEKFVGAESIAALLTQLDALRLAVCDMVKAAPVTWMEKDAHAMGLCQRVADMKDILRK